MGDFPSEEMSFLSLEMSEQKPDIPSLKTSLRNCLQRIQGVLQGPFTKLKLYQPNSASGEQNIGAS